MNELVEIHGNSPVTTTLKVAEFFEKEHFHVLRDLKLLMDQISTTEDASNSGGISNSLQHNDLQRLDGPKSENFFKQNFKEITYLDGANRGQVAYEMTKSGFALLAMGFTGPKALQFKVGYIQAFDAMEAQIKSKQAKELLRLSNFETLYEKAERDYSEMQHNVYNLYEPMRMELSRLKQDLDLDRKEARDRLIEEKADKKFETWKRQMGKVWAKRFDTIKKNLDAIEKRYAKLHKEHDNEISRLVQRALIETTASTDF